MVNGAWQAEFTARTNWLYTLERTQDLQSWSAVSPTRSGMNERLSLADTDAPAADAYYRVRAELP
jgi:hypothetical protein